MSTGPQPASVQQPHPVVTTFDDETQLGKSIADLQRFWHRKFADAVRHLHEDAGSHCVLVTARPDLLQQSSDELRNPAVRVIVLSDELPSDPRLKSAIYAYLPLHTPPALLERMIENAFDHIHVHETRRKAFERLSNANQDLVELHKIGVALSSELDPEALLRLILSKGRQMTRSDAGSLYLVERKEGSSATKLRFKLAQNDSVDLPFKETLIDVNENSIAGHVALSGESLNLSDAYHLPASAPYAINRRFDEDSGYRTKSILAVPMKNAKGEIVGVLQLINAKRDAAIRLSSQSVVDANVIAFTDAQQDLMLSLASQAAVALENSRLYESIQKLFEGFVKASVTAIESRDPTTSGHSFRVANLTVALAEAVDRTVTGEYASAHFTRTQMREIRYASLLHDFGKVGVKEEVLVKAKKLYPAQLQMIRHRFELAKRAAETAHLRQHLGAMSNGKAPYRAADLESGLKQQWRDIDHALDTVINANEPTVLPEGSFERLLDIAERTYESIDGSAAPLLTEDEVRLLSIRQGSLDDSEREQIESHVMHTYRFLQQIPWTNEIRGVPDIALGHHEKMNGSGYPHKLTAQSIPVQTRMMTISDIFDALSAVDRPYKRAVNLERALNILELSVTDGELDPELFRIFIEARIFDRWLVECVEY